MQFLYTIYFQYRVMFMVNLGAFLVCWKLPRRKYFWILFALGVALNILFTWVWWEFFSNFRYSDSLFLQCSVYLIQYVFTLFLVYFMFDCKIITALFCATCGYCLQQLVARSSSLIPHIFDVSFPVRASILIYIFVGAVIYTLFYLYFRKYNEKNVILIRNPIQLVIMTLALLVMIFTEQAIMPLIFSADRIEFIASTISTIVFSFVVLMLEINLLAKEEYLTELNVLKQIAHKEREQFELEKAVVDMINIKAHDLKHQLCALSGRVDPSEVEKIRSAVDTYDSSFKTGNTALDVVLTMKSLACKNKKIELTVLLDGKKLSFISDADIYSLFGNILDNAIEAAEKMEDEEKRVISITMTEEKSLLFIRAENYFKAEPVFIDGLPQTTKEEKAYHGYGLKSIKMIVSGYGGDINISMKNGVFALDIMFLPESST